MGMPVLCGACNSSVDADARFCGGCGHRVVPDGCPSCAAGIKPGDAYCHACGAAVAEQPADDQRAMPPLRSKGLQSELSQLNLRSLIPVAQWWASPPWKSRRHAYFMVFAAVPFLFILVGANDASVTDAAWAFGLYFSAMWLAIVRWVIQPEGLTARDHAWIAGLTATVGVLLVLVVERLLLPENPGLISMIVAVGIPEEVGKFLPLYIVLWRQGRSLAPVTWAYAGFISGLTFGVVEAVMYSTRYAVALELTGAVGSFVLLQVWRLVGGSVFHACLAGIVGYFAGLGMEHRHVGRGLVVVGLGLAAVAHGAYDAFAGTAIGAALAIAIVATFLAYVHSSTRFEAELRAHVAPPADPR